VKGGAEHHRIVRTSAAQDGQAAVEYAVILALVAAGLIVAYGLLGDTVVALYDRVVAAFT
jgi:Flp pilus assembly pilin Flp